MIKEKIVPKITALKKFKTNYVANNVVVATKERLKYQIAGSDYWNDVRSGDESIHHISDISSLEYYTYDSMTPEGQKLWDEYKAKKDEDEEDND